MANKMTLQGTAQNVRDHTVVRGGGTHQGQVNVRSYETITFDLRVQEDGRSVSVPVEIVGGSAFRNTGVIRSVPVSDGDQVRVQGIQKRGGFIRATETENLTTGVSTSSRKWSL
jgi:hypothetical protein